MAEPTAQEVLMWQLIDRARLDPLAEAAHFGIDLNEGLTPGTLAGGSRQPPPSIPPCSPRLICTANA